MELRSVFIQNLKKFRKERKISQMKLAELCSSSTNYIGEIEIGKKFPSVEMIQKISNALDIEPYKLFMETSKNKQESELTLRKKQNLIAKLQQSVKEIIESETLF